MKNQKQYCHLMLTQFVYIPHNCIHVDLGGWVGGRGEGDGEDAMSARLNP